MARKNWRWDIRYFLTSLRRPIPQLPTPTGVLQSEADAIAHAFDPLRVCDLFRDDAALAKAIEIFRDFMKSEDAHLVLCKAFHIAIEARMRALALRHDPPTAHGFTAWPEVEREHPLDCLAAEWLGWGVPPIRRSTEFAIFWHSWLQAGRLVLSALLALFRARPSLRQQSVHLGAPITTPLDVLRGLLSCAGLGSRDAVVILENPADLSPSYVQSEFRIVSVPQTPIFAGRWIREAVAPAFQLCTSVLGLCWHHRRNPVFLQVAIDIFRHGRDALKLRALSHAYRFGAYLDIDEYTATHIVRGIELRRFGTRLVRMPHSQMDEPGAALSFLGYDVFLSAGPYIVDTYGASWRKDCRSVSVGMFRTDKRLSQDNSVDPQILRAASDHLAAGGKVIAMFGLGNYDRNAVYAAEWLNNVVEPLLDRPEWLLIFKCKRIKSYTQFLPILHSSRRAMELVKLGRLLVPEYARDKGEPCPVGWLIRRMTFGIGLGSVQLEALTQAKPVIGYHKLSFMTPYRKFLVDHGLWFDNIEAFSRAYGAALDDPGRLDFPVDWILQRFDPFNDSAAIDRISAAVFGDAGKSDAEPAS